MKDDEPERGPSFPVVGIGASAGGLEALELLFENMPRKTGMAYVVLQHLSPDFESRMDELLARKTAIPIHKVTDGVAVAPDSIYLNPPRKDMIISGGRLLLTDKDPDRGLTLPIDQFFRSLANDVGPLSVGVILSGTGSDGSRGVKDIHEAGGTVIVQVEETARFDGMPRAARQTGIADLFLAPQDIPDALTKAGARSGSAVAAGSPVPLAGLDKILDLLRSAFGIDFAHYKPNTVERRIERRIAMSSSPSLEEYVARLGSSRAELDTLYRDLLIGVTRFFRDSEAFRELEQHVIPGILANTPSREEVRVWCAGCATGEEAYSIAMLFHEKMEAAARPLNLKIFATDMHKTSLEVAGQGLYSEDALAEVTPTRRERYFVPRDNGMAQVSKELRQLIVFAPHNVISDAPFTKLDFVSCRNLLIYLQPPAQKKALSLFHFGLKTGGYLLLGPSEGVAELSDELECVERHWKLYRKRRDVRLPMAMRMPVTLPASTRRKATWQAGDGNLSAVYDKLLAEFMPQGLLVDEHFELLHCFAGAEQLIRMPAGRPSTNLLDLVQPELKTPISGALQQAARDQTTVRFTGVNVRTEAGETSYRIQVQPFSDERAKAVTYLITLETIDFGVKRAPVDSAVDLGKMSEDCIEALENELRFSKESLQATIEELETSNEEMQATNEELLAANEELQSTNEELHSVNEELHTVNSELSRKIAELSEATADLDSALLTTDVGLLFLDSSLFVRKFTPKIVEAFQLLPQDVGRLIEAFSHKLAYPTFRDDVRRVLETGRTVEREVDTVDGHAYFLRILPYRKNNAITGVVVTLLDINAMRAAERNSRLLATIVESSLDAIIATDPGGTITQWNRGAERLYGWMAHEMVSRPLESIVPAENVVEVAQLLARVRRGEAADRLESVRRHKDGTLLDVWQTVSPILGRQGEVAGMSSIERDISPQKRTEEEIREAVRHREQFLAVLSHELRNPMAAVTNAARVLRDNHASGDLQSRAITVLQRQTSHMSRLLDDLLDISRIRQGKLQLRNESIDLRRVVDDAIETAGPIYAERGVRLEREGEADAMPAVGDPHRVRQMIVNLLTNAARHSATGQKVLLSLHRKGERAALRVRDDGDGIEPAEVARLFQVFATGDPKGQRSEGLGIGLWLVRSIAEAHGGTVTARSEGPGKGSEFLVELPLVVGEWRAPAADSQNPMRGEVLLVEDQMDTRDLLEAILAGAGLSVRAVGSGEKALELAAERLPSLAVIDIGLPGISGLDVARQIRTLYPQARIRLVALTGFGQQSDRQEVFESGFDQHLVKPIDIDLLLHVLRGELKVLGGLGAEAEEAGV